MIYRERNPNKQERKELEQAKRNRNYESFKNFILNHKVDGVPLIEIVNELEYGE